MPCGMNLEAEWDGLTRRVQTRDVTSTVHAEDAVHLDVRLLPILPEAALVEILRESLAALGWTRGDDGAMTRPAGTATATLSPDGRAVTLRAVATAQARGRVVVRVDKDTPDAAVEDALDAEAARQTEALQAKEGARLARATLEALTAQEPDVRQALQEALNRTYRRALEVRARELGEVESVVESGQPDGSYEVTVVVKA